MPFTVPTLDKLHDFVIGVLRAVLPTKNWSRYAPGWKFFRGVSVAVTELHAHITGVVKDLLPDTASDEYLSRWGKIRGVTRKSATPARKSAALRITGTDGSTVSQGDALVHDPTGLRFEVNEDETIPAAGFVDVDVVAVDVGKQTRLSKGETLRFSSPPSGVNEEAVLQLDLDEDGDDQENVGAYRERILDRFANPPLGGAQNDYVQWALEVSGVASAYAYPGRAGKNSVDVAALHAGTGSARLLSAGERTTLKTYLDGKIPAGVALRVLEVQATPTDVEVTYVPFVDVAFEADWDDSTPPVVSAWNGTTRELTFTTARPASMQAGDRLVFKDATNPPADDGRQYVIESLVSTDKVILEEVPSFTPANPDTVYSGGPLVDSIRDAILEHMDALGTSNTDTNLYGTWEANLRQENIYLIAQDVEGVRKSTVVQPTVVGSPVQPADNPYPADDIVFVLTPRRVLVRKA